MEIEITYPTTIITVRSPYPDEIDKWLRVFNHLADMESYPVYITTRKDS